jgi:hypothetical protein
LIHELINTLLFQHYSLCWCDASTAIKYENIYLIIRENIQSFAIYMQWDWLAMYNSDKAVTPFSKIKQPSQNGFVEEYTT